MAGLREVVRVEPPDEDDELLAAPAPEEVPCPECARERLPDDPQHLVPSGMPVPVVDALESVDVQEEQSHRQPVALLLGKARGELYLRIAAVPGAGERVDQGEGLQLPDPLRRENPCGDVVEDLDGADDLARDSRIGNARTVIGTRCPCL